MENLHRNPDIKSSLFFGAPPSIHLIADNLKDFLRANVVANFLSDPQGVIGIPRDHLKPQLPLGLGQRNPTKGQYSQQKMEGTETQYYTGGMTGGQGNWKVSDAGLRCIIVSSA